MTQLIAVAVLITFTITPMVIFKAYKLEKEVKELRKKLGKD